MPVDHLAPERHLTSSRANLRHLRPFAIRHWRKMVLGTLLIVVSSAMVLIGPLIYRYLIDEVILARQLHLLAGAVLLLAALKLLTVLAKLVQRFFFAGLQRTIILDIQEDLLRRVLRFPQSFFDENEVGYLMARLLADVRSLRWFFERSLTTILRSSLHLVGGLAFLFYLKWPLAVMTLVTMPAIVICTRYFSRKARVLSHLKMENRGNVSRQMQESLSVVPLIKAFGSEERQANRIIARLRSVVQISMEQIAVSSVASQLIGSSPNLVRFAVFVVGAYWVIQGDWTLGSLLAYQAYLGHVYQPARSLANANIQLQNALASLERVSALYDIVPEDDGEGLDVDQLMGEVEFHQVSFAYDEDHIILDDVSFRIPAGGHVAIVGPSGVGKTTLVSLLLRFYHPTTGEIWFDGRPASEYALSSLRQRIGYVSQSTLLLSGTIGENLRYGNSGAKQEEVVRAAQTASIHDFITSLPQGYDSPVGEGGSNLSVGQKQRLAIARALIKDPDILVLDEPTAALDSLAEKSIFDALPSLVGDKTMFVVAHRLATARHADRVLLLNEQRLVASGTHEELMSANTYYQSLVANEQVLTPSE